LRCIQQRLRTCKVTLHLGNTKIVNLRGRASARYTKKYDFLGFTIVAIPKTESVKNRKKVHIIVILLECGKHFHWFIVNAFSIFQQDFCWGHSQQGIMRAVIIIEPLPMLTYAPYLM